MLLNTGVTVAVKSLTKPMWLLISGLSVLMLLVAYVAVHGSATFTIASLQLNIPMAVYVIWSVYRARTLIKRASTEQAKVKKDKTGSAGQASQCNSAEGASA